ncbi:hypothetical protein HELRODRAFT_194865 [Helobdella robusta]|uniref:BACK domain-containing protein n=1 Tax=Helobdella robusta TaxID=6412 RepID=T1FWI1_HELRO|nr:hypothetical protein HELRODRAFT_194865 [Helobdella robusta]ESO11242.1 hypothetical protein HELRODRAFT_194865 [Helobdella robusta]
MGQMELDSSTIVFISKCGKRFEFDRDLLLEISNFFQNLVSSGMGDANSRELKLECLTETSLQQVRKFLANFQTNKQVTDIQSTATTKRVGTDLKMLASKYESIISLEALKRVEEGLIGALFLQIDSMEDMYVELLLKQLNESTYIRILQFAKKYLLGGVINRALGYVLKNFKQLAKLPEILTLSSSDILHLVKADFVNTEREVDIFNLIIRWVSVDESRRQFAENLLNEVKYDLMTRKEKQESYMVALNELELHVCPSDKSQNRFCSVGTMLMSGDPMNNFESRERQNIYSIPVYSLTKTHEKRRRSNPLTIPIAITKRRGPHFDSSYYGACVADRRLYVAGGRNRSQSRKSFSVYDPICSKWSRLPDMHVARSEFYFGEMDGHLYAVAGSLDPENTTPTVEKFNREENRWCLLEPLPTAVFNLAGTVCSGMLFVSGGCEETLLDARQVCWYDPTRNKWCQKAPLLTARFDHVMVTLGQKIIVVGGLNELKFRNDAEIYDCQTDQWSFLMSLSLPVSIHNSIIISNHLYVFGGSSKPNLVQDISLQTYLSYESSPSQSFEVQNINISGEVILCKQNDFYDYGYDTAVYKVFILTDVF